MTRPGRASPSLRSAVLGPLVVALLWPPSIAASDTASDVLVGPNGERIPGTLVSERDGWIEFDSILLGRLRVEADRVRIERKSTGSVEPRVATAAARPGGPNDLNREGVEAKPNAAPTAAAPLLSRGLAPAPILARIGWVPDGWTQSVGLSARVLGGSREDDKVEATVEYKAQRGDGDNASSFDLRYSREREEGVVSENDWRVSLRHEYEFGDRRFSVGSFTHRGDLDGDERKLSRSLAGGSGWRLAETDRVNLRLAPGYAFVRVRDARGSGSGDSPGGLRSSRLATLRHLRAVGYRHHRRLALRPRPQLRRRQCPDRLAAHRASRCRGALGLHAQRVRFRHRRRLKPSFPAHLDALKLAGACAGLDGLRRALTGRCRATNCPHRLFLIASESHAVTSIAMRWPGPSRTLPADSELR